MSGAVAYPDVTAAILAGGSSRRMGTHKALLEFSGKPLLQHLVDGLSTQVGKVLVAGCPETGLYDVLGVNIVTDITTNAGPLSGIAAALNACTTPYLLVIPCDNPCQPVNLLPHLYNELQAQDCALVYACDASGKPQPVYALASVALRDHIAGFVQQGGRKMLDWMAAAGGKPVSFPADVIFPNINTPADWLEFQSGKH